jgi:hypothetical protein
VADRRLRVSIIGDSRSLERAFTRSSAASRGFERDVGRASRGVLAGSQVFGGLGRSIAFASGAFLGAAGLTSAIRGAFSELADAQRVTAQTNAVLRSTGGIAGVTGRQVDNLAQALLRKSGIDDEAIKSGENLLLTFTNVRNVIGDGNDVFDQATKAALDLSVAMGEDLQSSIVRVGKALQDPVKGSTALRRVGVLLTQQQQAQIKSLVRQNDVLGAQRIILRELRTEFGGSAAALGATPVGKVNLLRETFRNFSAELVAGTQSGVVPLVDRLQEWFDKDENLVRTQKRVNSIVNTSIGLVKDFASAINAIDDAQATIEVNVKDAAGHVLKPGSFANLLLGPFARDGGQRPGLRGPTAPLSPVRPTRSRPPGLQGPLTGAGLAEPPDNGLGSRGGVTAAQRNQFFDRLINRRLGRVQDVRTLRGQIGALTEIAALIQQRFQATKDVTRRATLEDALVTVFRQRAQVRGEIAANRRAATVAARESILARLGFGVDRATATRSLKDDVAALNTLSAELRRQIAAGGDVLALQQQLLGVTQQIAGVREERAARAREQAARRVAARQTAQFRALGLTGEGAQPVPGVKTLRGLLGRVDDAVKGTFLDTKHTRSVLAGIRQVLSGQLGQVRDDVRGSVQGILADLNRQLREHEATVGKRWRKVNYTAILRASGLDPDEIRRVRAQISRVGPGGTMPINGVGAFGRIVPASRPIVVESHTHLDVDGWQMAKVVTTRQQVRDRRNPPQKRGPHRS